MRKKKRKSEIDGQLLATLEKAYKARARVFYEDERLRTIGKLFDDVARLDVSGLDWNLPDLGISPAAHAYLRNLSIAPHRVFAHPKVLSNNKHLVDYYRNLAAISKKGLGQLLSGTAPSKRLIETCRLLNTIISHIIESVPDFTLDRAYAAMIAEVGSELQGTWVNRIGAGAAKAVQQMITSYAQEKGYVQCVEKTSQEIGTGRRRKTVTQTTVLLKNGWRIVYSSEPDIGIYDGRNVLRSAIEVKGSMDKAGAQTRFGEAKKSFAKAIRENQRCETIYLASCFTDSLMDHIQQNGQVRRYYNLTDILTDTAKKEAFLRELFKYIIRIEP